MAKLFRGDHGTFYRFDTFSHGTRGIMREWFIRHDLRCKCAALQKEVNL